MNKDKQLDIERGKRVKQLRNLAGLAAVDLAKLVGISRTTMSYWETGTISSLHEAGALKLISIFQDRGIKCDFNWLWTGKGDAPSFVDKEGLVIKTEETFISSIEKEIEVFKKLNEDVVVLKIKSTAYWPFFNLNEFVGGSWQPIDSLRSECFAIVTINKKNELKWVEPLHSANQNLVQISNLSPRYSNNLIEQIELEYFAPVIRTWKFQ